MNKYILNIIVSILSFLAIFMIYCVYPYPSIFLMALVFVVAHYLRKNSIKVKVVKRILDFLSAALFLFITLIITIALAMFITNISDLGWGSYNDELLVISIYFLFRMGIDAFIDYKNKIFNFSVWLNLITLVIIDLVIIRMLICKLTINVDYEYMWYMMEQNHFYFFMMLSACMVSTIDFTKRIKIKLEDIIKLLIGVVVSLSLVSLFDTYNIYTTNYEYQPIICLCETHTDKKSTYYAFGYSITYNYGNNPTTEYRLFNLIPFYKR